MQRPAGKSTKTMRNPERKLLWFIIALAMAGAAVVWYLRGREMDRQEHESAVFLIKIASQQAAGLCREFAEIELKRKNLEIAKEVNETGLADAYARQIAEREQNNQDLLSGFNDTIARLGELRKKVVDEELNVYTKVLLRKELFAKAQATRLVTLHYQKFLSDRRALTIEAMRQACADK